MKYKYYKTLDVDFNITNVLENDYIKFNFKKLKNIQTFLFRYELKWNNGNILDVCFSIGELDLSKPLTIEFCQKYFLNSFNPVKEK